MKPLILLPLAGSLLCTIAATTYGQENSSVWTKSIGIQYATPESNPPSVMIEYPASDQQVADSVIQAQIAATDDTRVEYFRFTLNGTQGDWSWAPAMQYPWGTSLQLAPGLNTFEVECADYWGNMATASVTFEYLPSSDPVSNPDPGSNPDPVSSPVPVSSPGVAPSSGLMLDIGNGGQVKPNYQGAALEMGQAYSMTARPAKGFKFDGWSGSVSSSRPKLKFVMQPNLSFTARFKDVKRPLNIITFRRAKATAAGTTPFATGKATDNSTVTNVYYQLNESGWETAITTNGWRNWETAALVPIPGRNVLESYAVDDSGLHSRTNRLKFRY